MSHFSQYPGRDPEIVQIYLDIVAMLCMYGGIWIGFGDEFNKWDPFKDPDFRIELNPLNTVIICPNWNIPKYQRPKQVRIGLGVEVFRFKGEITLHGVDVPQIKGTKNILDYIQTLIIPQT